MLLSTITHDPEHSLVNQSKEGGYHPGCSDPTHIRNMRVNGDGFGVAWYSLRRRFSDKMRPQGACVFRSTAPAWSNHNLRALVRHIDSSLIFAHVRAVHMDSDRIKNDISEDNCHPFSVGRYTFVHNGCISGFSR